MEKHPWAWLFFIIFIVVTTFMVLNLFIGVVVNAMQAEAVKSEEVEREAEREIVHEEAAPILTEVKRLRAELAELRKEMAGKPRQRVHEAVSNNRRRRSATLSRRCRCRRGPALQERSQSCRTRMPAGSEISTWPRPSSKHASAPW